MFGVVGWQVNKKPSKFRSLDSYLVSERSQPFFFFLFLKLQVATIWKKACVTAAGEADCGRWLVGKIAALGMEIVVRYGKEGKDDGLDSEVKLAAPQTDNFAF